MNKKDKPKQGGLAGTIIKFFALFALAMGVTYLVVFAVQLISMHGMIRADEERQQAVVAGKSTESMTSIIEENLRARIKWAADRADDEFWIAAHNLRMLQNQVADIYKNPNKYGRRTVLPPSKDNAGVPSMQLLCSMGYENIPAKSMETAQRLANLEPMLKEFLIQNEFNVDIVVATTDGLALFMDRLADKKIKDDGDVITVDFTGQDWYKGAIERGDIFFYPIHSMIYDFDEVAYAAPVYVDDKIVAVLQGSIRTDMLKSFLEGRDIGESGFTVLISDRGQLVCSPRTSGELKINEDLTLDVRDSVNSGLKETINLGLSGETGVTKLKVDGQEYYAAYGYMSSNKWTQIIFVSVDEVMKPTNELLSDMKEVSAQDLVIKREGFRKAAVIAIQMLLVILLVGIVTVSLIAKRRSKPLALMAKRVSGLTGDNMSFEMDKSYMTGDEIQVLAESFRDLSEKMNRYIKEIVAIMSEKERVNAELSLATRIQADMLPSNFPAFPERTDFDIYASMTPAKEVGGDFYDFFFAAENKLAMVMADVSGKGVPAAMFMMMAKTMIQTQLSSHQDVAKALEDVNNIICANNREKMFVTVWVGILDLETGVLTAANAGHEYPIYKEPDKPFEIIKDKHGFVIGGKRNMKYTNYEIAMKPGSKLFVYTDGVPEAMNEAGVLFGMERALGAVNAVADFSPEAILANVAREVRKHVGDAEQFDDLTMLCIEYLGSDSKS
ncbi:MAG: hypothetical protein E7241_09330 [Lachnospiraceae bacterium]|nr:hypothetical protein [Lachnospiraceae bacterium]